MESFCVNLKKTTLTSLLSLRSFVQWFLVLFIIHLSTIPLFTQTVDNVVLITLDGLRWQELFGGAVDSLISNKEYTHDREYITEKFSASTKEEARKKLMPWMWSKIETEGQLYGNRWVGNKMNCSNKHWFSYPGYNEILTGYSDNSIDSNDKIYNPNVTLLEWLALKPEFTKKVAVFASWDVFPYIINDKRSGIPVNAGFRKADGKPLTVKETFLNELQDQIPSPWSSVRLDAFTHNFMMEYINKNHPRVIYIAYGETDDFAHDGRYDHYLRSANQTDKWIRDLWNFLQEDSFYKDKTSIIITTDHGRGTSPISEWKSHGNKVKGSNEIWLAALGPNIPAKGVISEDQLIFQNQIAQTIAKLLGHDYRSDQNVVGEEIKSIRAQ